MRLSFVLRISDRYEGAEIGALLIWDFLKLGFRSVSNVGRYIVVGAPDVAAGVIDIRDHLIPVMVEAFGQDDAAR